GCFNTDLAGGGRPAPPVAGGCAGHPSCPPGPVPLDSERYAQPGPFPRRPRADSSRPGDERGHGLAVLVAVAAAASPGFRIRPPTSPRHGIAHGRPAESNPLPDGDRRPLP